MTFEEIENIQNIKKFKNRTKLTFRTFVKFDVDAIDSSVLICRPTTMETISPVQIKRLLLTEEEKRSRNRKKNGWMVFFSRFVVELRKVPYESLKELVVAENLRGGNAATRSSPTLSNTFEGAARCTRSRPVMASSSVSRGGMVSLRICFFNTNFHRTSSSSSLFLISKNLPLFRNSNEKGRGD